MIVLRPAAMVASRVSTRYVEVDGGGGAWYSRGWYPMPIPKILVIVTSMMESRTSVCCCRLSPA